MPNSNASMTEPARGATLKGGLVHLTYTYDVGDGAASEYTTDQEYIGYFVGAHYVPTAAAAGTDVTLKHNGVDLLGGDGTNIGNNITYFPAVVDIGGTNTYPSIGIPFQGTLLINTAGGTTDDSGVIHVWIRVAGEG